MKFAQYLHDTQTPEWKKAYIDYRGLKKRITIIRKSQQGVNFHVLPSDDSPDEDLSPPATPRASDAESDEYQHSLGLTKNRIQDPQPVVSDRDNQRANSELPLRASDSPIPKASSPTPSAAFSHPKSSRRMSFNLTSFRRGLSFSSRLNGTTGANRRIDPLATLPLHELLTQLSPQELSFFVLLDAQLDKVESFYLAREKEMLSRGHALQLQLKELQDHQKLFHEAQSQVPWATNITSNLKSLIGIHPTPGIEPLRKAKPKVKSRPATARTSLENVVTQTQDVHQGATLAERTVGSSSAVTKMSNVKALGKRKDQEDGNTNDDPTEHSNSDDGDHDRPYQMPLSADPDSYLYAKRKLKKAVLEHYRGLEVLHNYRVLNITGFRKALKKFEKVTKIPVQQQYMTEKVEKSAFASDKAVRQMMTEMEEMYATAFARGDKKRATRRLRAGNSSKSHHFSAFRSGVFIGLAFPALIEGLVKVFQQKTREAIPAWAPLLYIYGLILVPVLFTFLVGINLLVWANARINYPFIFELNVLTQLDYRQYFEIPSILIAGLCYAFWMSFSLVGYPNVSPTIWPLVWLGFTCTIVVDPLPFLYRSSRYWLIKSVARQFASGTRPVEFTDFWLGDQFCSLIFTLSNLYFFVCVYVNDFAPDWQKCGATSPAWPISFVIATLPLLIRLVQSIKRYADSKLITHLINGGKYGTGILAYFFYFMWRHRQNTHGSIFAVWCILSTCYSIYAGAWDLLMDWSVLRLHNKYPLLRPELVYSNHTPMYYFAIVTNILIRFIWIIYIPSNGPNMMVRTFIAGFLEMLRRWQWNFYRLENEHLGNMDQYRVTREVPLPYAFNDRSREDDADDHDDRLQIKR